MRDIYVRNYIRKGDNVPISKIALRDVIDIANASDAELSGLLEPGETCDNVRERCHIELIIREIDGSNR